MSFNMGGVGRHSTDKGFARLATVDAVIVGVVIGLSFSGLSGGRSATNCFLVCYRYVPIRQSEEQ